MCKLLIYIMCLYVFVILPSLVFGQTPLVSTRVNEALKRQLGNDGKWISLEFSDGSTQSTASFGGDVVGPASSVDSEIAIYNSTTGKLLKRFAGTGILTATSGVIGTATTTGTGDVVLATSPTVKTPTVSDGAIFNLLSNNNITIDASTNPRTVTTGVVRINHTPGMVGTRPFTLNIDAAGFGDTHAVSTDFTATGIGVGEQSHLFDINVNTANSTGGEVNGFVMAKTGTGAVDCNAVEVYPGVDVIVQRTGVETSIEQAFSYNGAFADITSNLSSAASDVQLFVANGDIVYIGNAGTFNSLAVTLAVVASGAGIKPTFEYSAGASSWTAFSPTDGTNGFRNLGGTIAWGTLAGWATDTVNAVGSKYWVRITRTQNTLTTPPTEDLIKYIASTNYGWDKDGNISCSILSVGTTATTEALNIYKGADTGEIKALLQNDNSVASDGSAYAMYDALTNGGSRLQIGSYGTNYSNAAFAGFGKCVGYLNGLILAAYEAGGIIKFWTGGSDGVYERMRLTDTGLVIGTTTANNAATKLTVYSGGIDLQDGDVAHDMTGVARTNSLGSLSAFDGLSGGLNILGLSDADTVGLRMQGYVGTSTPSSPAVIIAGHKKNGAAPQSLGNAETVIGVDNYATRIVTWLGDGTTRLHKYGVGLAAFSSNGTISSENISGIVTSVGAITSSGVTLSSHAKAQVLEALYNIIPIANFRGLWAFDQTGAVSTLTDRSLVAHNVSLVDNTLSAINASTMTPGITGVSTYLTLDSTHLWNSADSDDFSFGNAGTDTAFSMIVVTAPTISGSSYLIAKDDITTGNNKREYWVTITSSGTIAVYLFDNSASAYISRASSAGAISSGLPACIVVTYSGNSLASGIKIYVNGVQVDTATDTGGSYVAMENLAAKLGSYRISAAGVPESMANGKFYLVGLTLGEMSSAQIFRINSILKGYLGTL